MALRKDSGIALMLLMVMLVAVVAIFAAYHSLTDTDLATTRSFKEKTSAFYAAEGGLNWRVHKIRKTIETHLLAGTPPTAGAPCSGTVDFACETYPLDDRYQATVSVSQVSRLPTQITVPPGEPYEGRNALQTQYVVISDAQKLGSPSTGVPEARLTMTTRVREIPIFQFAVFFDKDLEFYPGPPMEISGPVHANGDLYVTAVDSLLFREPISVAGDMLRGLKFAPSVDYGGQVNIAVPSANNSITNVGFLNNVGSLTPITSQGLQAFSGRVRVGLPRVLLPDPASFLPQSGSLYWDNADLRLVLNLANPTLPRMEIHNASGVDSSRTSALATSCPAGTVAATKFLDRREGSTLVDMLDVHLINLLACAEANGLLEGARHLDDISDGGLVIYLSVFGSRSSALQSFYGVRIHHADDLASIAGRNIRGLTIVSDQPLFTKGNVNSGATPIPMALMGDTINVLSNAALDNCPGIPGGGCGVPVPTLVRAAIIAGSDTTGNAEGVGGRTAPQSGGLQNFIRFHEDWAGGGSAGSEITMSYQGSLVSLSRPKHAAGEFQAPGVAGSNVYTAPRRDWRFDTAFNNPQRLPPLTPRFTYLQQELFSREVD